MADLRAVALGQQPADLLLTNARVVNVFTGQVEAGNVAIAGGRIVGVGGYTQAKAVIDLKGQYLAPAFIDGHVHVESSLLTPGQYGRAVVPHGTGAVITDLHEIANVAGSPGMRYVLDSARRLPLDVFLMAPSCVPATNLETSGAALDAAALRPVLRWRSCVGLGEVMNYPGVLAGDPAVLAKLRLAGDRPIDGHAPGLRGGELDAYIAAGIQSDHESVTTEEGAEKLAKGMLLMIREGSSEKNLAALLPLVTEQTYPRCLLVVDDRTCVDLLDDGDIDAVVRKAVSLGLDPVRAIQLATINPARYFRLPGLGAVAPGYRANLAVLDDLREMRVSMVFHEGRLVARDGQPLFEAPASRSSVLVESVKARPLTADALRLPDRGDPAPVIEIIPGQIVTRRTDEPGNLPDATRDVLKAVVVERHHATGHVGVGLVRGFGLKSGALASSVAHDSHNIVAVGVSDAAILTAVAEIVRVHGGLVAAADDRVIASLPLPVAGLLSDEPLDRVVGQLRQVERAAAELGCRLPSPFATLSFLALPVIPELRRTDLGLVDVTQFRLLQ